MKNILAIDTSSKLMGVSLKSGGNIFSDFINDGYAHSENLLPMIDKLLKLASIRQNDLELLICTRGPGSFTGLRIGMSTLKGISLGLNIPLISVPTLDLYSFSNLNFNGVTLPIIDARKRCYYTAVFEDGIKKSDDLDLPVDEIIEILKNKECIFVTGVDAKVFYEKIEDDRRFVLDENPERNYSEDLLTLGLDRFKTYGADSPNQGPLYIRKSEAEIMLNKKAK